MKVLKNKYLIAIALFITGFFLSWMIFSDNDSGSGKENQEGHNHTEDTIEADEEIWTCSMHPQIRQSEPGLCPICGMELIPLSEEGASGELQLSMSKEAVSLANIQTSPVQKALPEKEIQLQGKIVPDETALSLITARYSGRLEELYIDYTGAEVYKGQKLASIYSPELITAQKELLEAKQIKNKYPGLYKASREKLRLWNLSEKQIDQIENSENVREVIDILAPMSGTVIERKATLGEYIQEGTVLFKIADLNKLWGVFDAYQTDLQWIQTGDEVVYSLSSRPGQTFKSKVTFIDPVIDSKSRVASVRVNIDNPKKKLKPNMFIKGTVHADLPVSGDELMVPKSSVMWTGTRSVVYVKISAKEEKPVFEFREVTIGEDLGNAYLVKDGLKAGEKVVTHGTFKVDAAAQLAGKRSMMNRDEEMEMTEEYEEQLKEISFTVYGVCGLCKDRIEDAASIVPGVFEPKWDVEKKLFTARIDTSMTSKKDVSKAIAEIGHKTEFHNTPKEVYDELPSCCKYTKQNENENGE